MSQFLETETKLRASEKGILQHFSVYPGIEISFTRFSSNEIPPKHDPYSNVLEINYCHKGMLVWNMQDGQSVYLNSGDLELHTMDCCASSTVRLPLNSYEGITVFVEPEKFSSELQELFREWNYNPLSLVRNLCPSGNTLYLSASFMISSIFSGLYDIPEQFLFHYSKLKAQELLFFLTTIQKDKILQIQPFTSSQTDLIQEIHDFLIQNIDHRYTIEELSKKYLLNTTTLKNVFKGVYGKPIGTYLKEYRIKNSISLLLNTQKSIAEIAGENGYDSPGKFTDAFRKYTGHLPSDYRKKYQF